MDKRKSSRVNDMNYEYYIYKGRVYETEKNNKKIPLDRGGESIKYLIENQKESALHSASQRKLEWLKKEHPELMI